MFENQNVFTVHESFVVEFVQELFRQVSGKLLFDFVTSSYIQTDVNTRRKTKVLLDIAYFRSLFQRRSLKNKIV